MKERLSQLDCYEIEKLVQFSQKIDSKIQRVTVEYQKVERAVISLYKKYHPEDVEEELPVSKEDYYQLRFFDKKLSALQDNSNRLNKKKKRIDAELLQRKQSKEKLEIHANQITESLTRRHREPFIGNRYSSEGVAMSYAFFKQRHAAVSQEGNPEKQQLAHRFQRNLSELELTYHRLEKSSDENQENLNTSNFSSFSRAYQGPF